MRIKVLTSLEGPDVSHTYGEVVDSDHPKTLLSVDAMKRMVEMGQAIEVSSKVEKAAPTAAVQRASLPPRAETR